MGELFKYYFICMLVISSIIRAHFILTVARNKKESSFLSPASIIKFFLCFLLFQISSFSLKMYHYGKKRIEQIVNYGNYGTLIPDYFTFSFVPDVGNTFPHHFSSRTWHKLCLSPFFVALTILLLLSSLALWWCQFPPSV